MDIAYAERLKTTITSLFFIALETYSTAKEVAITYDHDVKDLINGNRLQMDAIYTQLVTEIDNTPKGGELFVDHLTISSIIKNDHVVNGIRMVKSSQSNGKAAKQFLDLYEESLIKVSAAKKKAPAKVTQLEIAQYLNGRWFTSTAGDSSMRQLVHIELNKMGLAITTLLGESKNETKWTHLRSTKSIRTILSKHS